MTPETTLNSIPSHAETREEKLAAALIAPPLTPHGLRRYSAASMIVLQILGNPLADFSAGRVHDIEADLYSLAEFVWVHSEAEALVRRMAYNHAIDRDAVRNAVLDLAAQKTPGELLSLVPEILRDAEQVEAAMATQIPEGNPPKNPAGHSSQQ